jgi:transcriptional regulator with XRE-family HTH domain
VLEVIQEQLNVLAEQAKESAGLTYDDLSELTGLSRSTVQYAISGKKSVSNKSFDLIFKACKMEVFINAELELSDE